MKMIRLCTIDLDGTLFDKEKNISYENRKAIQEAKENGCKIVIASGRPLEGVLPVLQTLNLTSDDDYVICYNGAKILNSKTKQVISSSYITGKDVKLLYQESLRLGTFIHAFQSDETLITTMHNPYTDVEVKINHIQDNIVDFTQIKDRDTFIKCMLVGDDETITSAIKRLNPELKDKYCVVRSSKIFLEFLNPETNKGMALEKLASYLGIGMAETMAIGDAGNDFEMIKRAGIGVAMANSFPEILKIADSITASNEASGVAEALNSYVNHKKKQ